MTLDKSLELTSKIYLRIAQGILLFLVLAILSQVVSRYVFARSTVGIDELTKIALVWLTFLMAVVLHRQKRHITVKALYDALPPRLQFFADTIVSLATIGLSTFVFWQIFQAWGYFGLLSPVFGIPDTALRAAPIFAFVPILLQEAVSLTRQFTGRLPDREAP